ncbi:unnamed protein product [Penicillium nalgiovense]|uniref:C2H2-type domain-containing protein n=1 Tax=Penicillium nalgiovense TaxID=60175 RepID=A0A9W4HXH7_PENNA|nr:unnamed protein product [Penicillium nalgiovense]CAG8048962.1 unnamed protein product [Penicillium nalgiovense]CAG8071718.1 unnamed protein product [Penicillium nalgiovense]CAG8103317.1 unnamed protein product [Penicillium nalgiovense]CAG8123800.1 unnamed protein product [Penicillium nalgiovense]
MNSNFNLNNEVDETMQWPGPPGSITSSEGFTGTDNDRGYGYYHTGTSSSADLTSLTSSEAYQDSGWLNIDPFSQVRVAPQQYDSDLAGIDPRYYSEDENNIPQSLAEVLGSSTITQRPADDPSESTVLPSGELDRTTIGIPDPAPFYLQPPTQPSHEGVVNQVVTTYRALMSDQACSPDQISQGLQNLETIKNFFHTKLPASPISIGTSEPDIRDKPLFRCWQCDPQKKKATFPSFGAFKRHLTMHGILDCEWRCTYCDISLHRRDRMRNHLIHVHNKFNLLPADVEATRVRYPPPTNCPIPICLDRTPSWAVYFEHIKSHCLISPLSGNASTNGDRSDHGDNGGGNGNRHCHGSSSARPSNSNRSSQSNESNNRTGCTPYPSASFPGFRNRGNLRPGSIWHSVYDDQLNPSRRRSAPEAIEQISIDDLLRSPGTSRAAHHPGGASGQPNNLLPPQDPRLSQGNHSSKRKRQDKQKEPTEEQAPSSNKCRRCNHDMAKCRHCKSVDSCHKCGDVPKSGIQVGASSTMPAQAPPDASSAIINLNEYHGLNQEALNFVTPQNMPTQPPPYYNPNEGMHFFDPQSFGDMTNTFLDDTFPNDPFIGVAMDVVSHPLRDLGDKNQESPVFESDTKLLRSIGLDTLIQPLSAKRQLMQPQAKASSGPAPGSFSDLQNNGSPSILEAPQPVSRCQCPCVTVPTVDYEAHASLQLSPDERVEMAFKMTPARESSHPLRTRVRVFVKLFSLRASAARSNTEKQRTRSISSDTTNEDAELEPDSDQEPTSTSPSGSEITPLLYWTEDIQDWSFSFDIKWALTKLAQWTSGIDADTCQKLLLSDASHILDLMSMYIVYKFKISWLLMGRSGLSVFLSI